MAGRGTVAWFKGLVRILRCAPARLRMTGESELSERVLTDQLYREVRTMEEATRVSVREAKEKTDSGTALLVCAYEDEEKFRLFHLQGAISLAEFRSKLPSLARDREIIFYCA
jgi:hypothetical protein